MIWCSHGSLIPLNRRSPILSSTRQQHMRFGRTSRVNGRFSQSNALRIFQLQQDIAYLHQGQMSVASYFTKMRELWDELASYNDSLTYSCGAMKKHHAREEHNTLMQFFMGLNESYSALKVHRWWCGPVSNNSEPTIINGLALANDSSIRPSSSLGPISHNPTPVSANNRFFVLIVGIQTMMLKLARSCMAIPYGIGYTNQEKTLTNQKEVGACNKSSLANHVDANPSFYDVKAVMPNLTN
ncbi:hypothetical protein L3X38_025494 [Prunus dulcis]|uniref:Retrotransposon gag domain-containing protein n=1 Tax=Prunus dulcis TaxID=3755 RepID=A0AAD4Z7E2_PRUDU|nr:hypothetical protein L3X38_025494 [Prunus dulcis]